MHIFIFGALLTGAFFTGALVGEVAGQHKLTNSAIEECERDLPRSKHCEWAVVAYPAEEMK